MNRPPGQEGERQSLTPKTLLIPVVWREWMSGLSPGHMEYAVVLMLRGHHEPLTGSEAILHHTNALPASGCRFIRHVEEIPKPRQRPGEWMLHPDTIQMSPSQLGQ